MINCAESEYLSEKATRAELLDKVITQDKEIERYKSLLHEEPEFDGAIKMILVKDGIRCERLIDKSTLDLAVVGSTEMLFGEMCSLCHKLNSVRDAIEEV